MSEDKPETTNPANLAPVDPTEKFADRKDIKAAKFEARLRRWAMVGVIAAIAISFVWQSFAR